jgi:hypothetical protein
MEHVVIERTKPARIVAQQRRIPNIAGWRKARESEGTKRGAEIRKSEATKTSPGCWQHGEHVMIGY